MANQFRIPVVTRTQENGDGGFTTYAYNTEDDLISDHPKSRQWKEVNGKYQKVAVILSDEERKAILTEDDPYENGMIDHSEIIVQTDDDYRNPRLAKPLSFHAGQ